MKSLSKFSWLINPISKEENASKRIMFVYIGWIILISLTWYVKDSVILPKPHQIVSGIVTLFKNGFAIDLLSSLVFTFKCMAIAILIAFVFAFLSLIPIMRPIIALIGKSRFLSTAGFTVVFGILTPDAIYQKHALLIFCIIVFQIVSFIDIIASVKNDRIDYCLTMKMKPWRIVWEEYILAKRSDMLVTIRQNFAIAWVSLPMVETISRVDGGIGIVLEDLKHHFKYDQIFAVQSIILICGVFIDFIIEKIRFSLFNKWA